MSEALSIGSRLYLSPSTEESESPSLVRHLRPLHAPQAPRRGRARAGRAHGRGLAEGMHGRMGLGSRAVAAVLHCASVPIASPAVLTSHSTHNTNRACSQPAPLPGGLEGDQSGGVVGRGTCGTSDSLSLSLSLSLFCGWVAAAALSPPPTHTSEARCTGKDPSTPWRH
jgi:hypothetical protein